MLGAGMLIAGPLVGSLMLSIPSLDGGRGLTPLISPNPFIGLLISTVCLLLAGLLGLLAAHLVGFRDGLATMGVAMAWACWSTGRLTDVIQVVENEPSLRLAAEGGILGLLACVVALCLVTVSRDFSDAHNGDSRLLSPGALVGVGAMILGAMVGGWIVAQTSMVGQTLGAAIAGGVLGGMIARLIRPDSEIRALLLGFPIIAGGAMLLGHWLTGSGNIIETVYSGTGSPLMRIMPIDWVAGLLIGLPVGLSWGGALVERHGPEKPDDASSGLAGSA